MTTATNWVSRLEEAWRLAESTHPAADQGIVLEDLDLPVQARRVLAGADASGFRHLLLPTDENTTVDGLFDGRSITFRTRPLIVDGEQVAFAALTCTRGELFPEFATLAADVLTAVEEDPSNLITAATNVLSDWRELLRALGGRGLDRNKVIGLYGELHLLERILRRDPARRTDCWTGADATRHDFQRGAVVAEVKTTTARRGRKFFVHGLDQLDAPPGANLYLLWTRIEAAVDRGESLRDLVDRLYGLVADTADFTRKLEQLDYRPQNPDDYAQPRFAVLERAFYKVDHDFPRLTPASFVGGILPAGISALSYEVDLSGQTALGQEEADRLLAELAASTST